jgi:hypothetical protein
MSGVVPTLSIRTPEGISFNLLLAGTAPRFLAWLIDGFALMLIGSILTQLANVVFFLTPSVGAAIGSIAYFIQSIF